MFRTLNELISKYKTLVWLAGIFLLALGFDFRLPGQTIRSLQAQVDTLGKKVVTTEAKVDVLLRLQCIDRKPGEDAKFLAAGVSCENILYGRR